MNGEILMINQRVHIAIIDDGVNVDDSDMHLYKNFEILDDLTISNSPSSGSGHALKAFLIMQKKIDNECYISSIKILNEKCISSIDKLCKGLEICKKMKVDIINLSLGSTMFYDRDIILRIVNELYNLGIIIIAAVNNNLKLTYPASFSNVICVKANKLLEKNQIEKVSSNFLGVDFEVFSNYRMESSHLGKFWIGNHNSYSAPIVTALVANIYRAVGGIKGDKIEIIKKKIYDEIKISKEEINIYYELDWLMEGCLIIVKNKDLYNELLEVNRFGVYNRIADILYVESVEELKQVSSKMCKKYRTIVISEIEGECEELLKRDINDYFSFQYVFLGKGAYLNYYNTYHNNKVFNYYDIFAKESLRKKCVFEGKLPIIFISKISRLFFLKLLYKLMDEGFNTLIISDDPYMILFLSNCIYVGNISDGRSILDNIEIEKIILNRNIDAICFFSIKKHIAENALQFVDLFIESNTKKVFLRSEKNKKLFLDELDIRVETLYDNILTYFGYKDTTPR